jgi:hypothetical protein
MKNSVLCTSAFLLTGFAPLITGCRGNSTPPQQAPIVDGNAASSDPASANMLAASGQGGYTGAPVTRVAGSQYAAAPQSSSEIYPQQTAPNYGAGNSQQNEAYQYNTQQPQSGQGGTPISSQEYDQYSDLLDSNVPPAPQPPPPLPVDYQQPEAPGPDYLWTPGYWDYASAGYYYVPGTWCAAPYAGALWTPGWWGYGSDRYRWHHGYWGRHVGYYGGINYGFGFIGFGYQGGYWNGDHFFYNRAVNRVSPNAVGNYVYDRRVSVVNSTYINNSRTSYVGGQGGLRRGPAPQELAAVHEQRMPAMQSQIANRQAAAQDHQQFFNANKGRPQMLTVARPLAADRGVTAPPRNMPAQGFANGRAEGVQPNSNMNPQQRQQVEQQHQQEQGQHLQQQQANVQQRQQLQAQRQQLNVQHQGAQQANLQQRQVEQQQRQNLDTQRQQQGANTQRQQLQDQQRNQQVQQRQVEQQGNIQRQQQVQQQREQNVRPAPAAAPRIEAPRATPAPHVEAARPAPAPRAAPAPHAAPAPRATPAPHVEAARPAPAPHMEAPHAGPAPQAHGEHH